MAWILLARALFFGILVMPGLIFAQSNPSLTPAGELHLHLVFPQSEKRRSTPAVIWLEPLAGSPHPTFVPHGHYTLLQKNRAFVPHLQVIPVGTLVQFPNADPFFHNVFSMFDGKRFDLGLYEAGTSKSVTFPREGVSYIFCNIHPEMSAVVLALTTPLYAIADAKEAFDLPAIPPGEYNLHLWIEGIPQSVTDKLSQHVSFSQGSVDLGPVIVPSANQGTTNHTNKFGNAYDPAATPTYNQ